jgi:hypothetical protein
VKFATLVGLIAAASPAVAADRPRLDMVAFFTGHTRTENVLRVVLHKPVPLIVESVGGKGDKGDFVMIDTVHEGDKPVQTRKWIMRSAGPNHMIGTLTDAMSPVDMIIKGDAVVIRYKMKGGLNVEQRLELQADGKTLSNHVVAKKFGVRVARVDGTVRKLN